MPPSVAPVGLLANATLTLLESVVTTFPYASSIEACMMKRTVNLDGARRLLRDHELSGRRGGHGHGVRDALTEAAAGGHERVAGPGRGDRQAGERGHAARGGHGQRAAQRGAAGVIRQRTVTAPLKEVTRLPELFSASTVRPKGLPAVTLLGGGWVTTRLVVARVARPIESVPVSPNQRLPSGPVVIARAGIRVRDGVLGDDVARRVDRSDLPCPDSVNQRLPSGPAVIQLGSAPLGMGTR